MEESTEKLVEKFLSHIVFSSLFIHPHEKSLLSPKFVDSLVTFPISWVLQNSY